MSDEVKIERWAMLDATGTVTNVCNWDGLVSTWSPPDDIIMKKAPDNVGIGWSYDLNLDEWVAPT